MASDTYNTGTVSVSNGGTTVTGSGTFWTDFLPGDEIQIGDFPGRAIASLTDGTHLELSTPWGAATQAGAPYTVLRNAPARFASYTIATRQREMLDRIGIFNRVAPLYTVQSVGSNTPPGSPVALDTYVVGDSPTGAWAGHAGHLVQWSGTAWQFTVGEDGWQAFDVATAALYVLDGTTWVAPVTQAESARDAALAALSSRMPFVASGQPLPTTDIGPVWHVDYASIMTWQVFNANGAAYTGYASVNVGDPILLGKSTARTGVLKANGSTFNPTAYWALYHWALHNGLLVSVGSWAAGRMQFGFVDGSNVKLPDLRGEFLRGWDDGRGVDSGRAFGSGQTHDTEDLFAVLAPQAGTGTLSQRITTPSWTATHLMAGTVSANGTSTTVGTPVSPLGTGETRPRNVAVLMGIKF